MIMRLEKGGVRLNHAEKIIKDILSIAFKKHATDIHFYTEEENVKIFYRINGIRKLKKTINFKQYTVILHHLKFITSMDIGEIGRDTSALQSRDHNVSRRLLENNN